MHGGGLELALVFLLAAVAAVPVFRRLGLGAVLGYLAAGAALGPDGLGVVRNAAPVLAASEIGVVMLLFVIGLELSPARLWVMRRPVFGAGGLQVLSAGAALALLAAYGLGLDGKAALVDDSARRSTPTMAGWRSRSCCSRTWRRFRCWRRSRCSGARRRTAGRSAGRW